MIKKRIFSVILAVLLVVCCVTEAFFIKFLENDNANLKEEVKALQSDTSDLKDQVENLNDTLTKKADEPSIEFYLPDHIYVCESTGNRHLQQLRGIWHQFGQLCISLGSTGRKQPQ